MSGRSRSISIVLLVTNAMLVLWALALRGGRLWVRRRSERAPEVEADAPGVAVA